MRARRKPNFGPSVSRGLNLSTRAEPGGARVPEVVIDEDHFTKKCFFRLVGIGGRSRDRRRLPVARKNAPGRVHTTRNVVLRQEKKAFYEGNILLWHLTGIKSLFDAGRTRAVV